MDPWTIRRVVAWASSDFEKRGVGSPRLDAELLVSGALGIDRVRLYMELDRPLDARELGAIREHVRRRRRREPVAYILGRREFWGRAFEVGPAVLVPRPDTEALVARALELLPEGAPARVLDLCTGSGAVGVTVAAERPGARVDLADLSREALEVAARNASRHGVRVGLLPPGDLFAPVEGRYDLITCNPPYVAVGELASLEPEVREHEPRLALVGGPTGLEVHERLAAEAGAHLEPGGTLLVEVGAGQAEEVERLLEARPWVRETRRHEDLGRVERVVEARAR